MNKPLEWSDTPAGFRRTPSHGDSSGAEHADRLHTTGPALQEEEHGQNGHICTVCLDAIAQPDRAVLLPCMHDGYHSFCIRTWFALGHRTCPLCKGEVEAWLHDIRGINDFEETVLSGEYRWRTRDRVAAMAEVHGVDTNRVPEGGAGAVRSEQRSETDGGSRSRERYGSTFRWSATRDDRWRSTGSARSDGEALGGRHRSISSYRFRLQHHLRATNIDHANASLSSTLTAVRHGDRQGRSVRTHDDNRGPHAKSIDHRRGVYERSLWAKPFEVNARHQPLSLIRQNTACRERRVSEFVDRELRAVLGLEDTGVLRPFVMGLLAFFGPSMLMRSEADGSISGSTDERSREALAALEPFLGREKAMHFWHEVSVFVTAPAYTLETYDSMVRYERHVGSGSGSAEDTSRAACTEEQRAQASHRMTHGSDARAKIKKGARRRISRRTRWHSPQSTTRREEENGGTSSGRTCRSRGRDTKVCRYGKRRRSTARYRDAGSHEDWLSFADRWRLSRPGDHL